jgi:hypothetical protein
MRATSIWGKEPDTGEVVLREDLGTLDEEDKLKLVEYLVGGFPLEGTSARTPDLLDPQAPAQVPSGWRTDGTWIWQAALSYYVNKYGVAPESQFLEHVRERDFELAEPSAEQVQEALVWIDALRS